MSDSVEKLEAFLGYGPVAEGEPAPHEMPTQFYDWLKKNMTPTIDGGLRWLLADIERAWGLIKGDKRPGNPMWNPDDCGYDKEQMVEHCTCSFADACKELEIKCSAAIIGKILGFAGLEPNRVRMLQKLVRSLEKSMDVQIETSILCHFTGGDDGFLSEAKACFPQLQSGDDEVSSQPAGVGKSAANDDGDDDDFGGPPGGGGGFGGPFGGGGGFGGAPSGGAMRSMEVMPDQQASAVPVAAAVAASATATGVTVEFAQATALPAPAPAPAPAEPALQPVADETKVLKAHVQVNGKGEFMPMQLTLTGSKLTLADSSDGGSRAAEVTGCRVNPPKSARKGHPHAFRVDLCQADSSGDKKYIIDPGSAEAQQEWMGALKCELSEAATKIQAIQRGNRARQQSQELGGTPGGFGGKMGSMMKQAKKDAQKEMGAMGSKMNGMKMPKW